MTSIRTSLKPPSNAKLKLLDAASDIVRAKGFSATSVDELCAAAGVTKGAFFHHFENKEALGVAAANHWAATTSEMFAAAPYHQHIDPLDRILAYLEFREAILEGNIEEFTCLVGTMVQESYKSSDAIRAACAASIFDHAETFEADINAAMDKYGRPEGVTARNLALHFQVVLQGAFVLAKAQGGPAIARDSVAHLKRYVVMLFEKEGESK